MARAIAWSPDILDVKLLSVLEKAGVGRRIAAARAIETAVVAMPRNLEGPVVITGSTVD